MTPAEQDLWRTERARVIGWLTRRFGDLDLAEEATQDALTALAAQRERGMSPPDNLGAWLSTVAYRHAIGVLRRRRVDIVHVAPEDSRLDTADISDSPAGPVQDDLLALLFGCCHPSLADDAQVALTLRYVCGLSTHQIAAAFLVAEPTMAKRLVRARRKVRDAAIPVRIPDADQLPGRLDSVRAVIYLMFNEGWFGSTDTTIDPELCSEARWLGDQLLGLDDTDPESLGLVALMCVHTARLSSRTGTDGNLVRFSDQDRSAWDLPAIERARATLSRAQDGTIGRYRLEAAIALLHASSDPPDWSSIADLYRLLVKVTGSPTAQLNRAIAVTYADGPRAGLRILQPLLDDPRLTTTSSLHAAAAELHDQLDDPHAAQAEWTAAFQTARSDPERVAIRHRLSSEITPRCADVRGALD